MAAFAKNQPAAQGSGLAKVSERPHSGVFRTGHPNRKQPSEPQNHKIKREENEEADLTTKLALDSQRDHPQSRR
jgi:hypothetical protein